MGGVKKETSFAVFLLFVSICACAENPPTRQIEERPLEVVDTGFEPQTCCTMAPSSSRVGAWIDNDRLIFSALRDEPDADKKYKERVVLFDWRTRSSTILKPEGTFRCYHREYHVANIGTIAIERNERLYAIADDGQLRDVTDDFPALSLGCLPANLHKEVPGHPVYLGEKDGYLQLRPPGKPAPTFDHSVNAVLYRPGLPPIEIAAPASEVDGGILRYFAFIDRYQLNRLDSRGDSKSDKRQNTPLSWGNRPYDLSPYRLLAPDGHVDEFPFPYILSEFGVRFFYELLPTKAGILVVATGGSRGERGLFLLNGERLTRVWGKPGLFSGGENMAGLALSPDGCKIAFRRYANWQLATPKHISIMNLCQGN